LEEIVCLNGSLLPLSQVKVSPFDYGFLYGYGLFETMRAYSGHIFRLDKHLARLSHSSEYLGINLEKIANIANDICGTLQANNLSDARVRVTVSGGEGEPGLGNLAFKNPTLLITTRKYTPHPNQTYAHGFKAIISHIRRNSHSPLSTIKSFNYLDNLLAQKEAMLANADEAILLNDQGLLAETSTGNLFIICGNTLITPSKDSGILPGITREAVLELAALMKIEVIEKEVTVEELFLADEIFYTNSVIELMPITQVDGKSIRSAKVGKITQRLIADYKLSVEKRTS